MPNFYFILLFWYVVLIIINSQKFKHTVIYISFLSTVGENIFSAAKYKIMMLPSNYLFSLLLLVNLSHLNVFASFLVTFLCFFPLFLNRNIEKTKAINRVIKISLHFGGTNNIFAHCSGFLTHKCFGRLDSHIFCAKNSSHEIFCNFTNNF